MSRLSDDVMFKVDHSDVESNTTPKKSTKTTVAAAATTTTTSTLDAIDREILRKEDVVVKLQKELDREIYELSLLRMSKARERMEASAALDKKVQEGVPLKVDVEAGRVSQAETTTTHTLTDQVSYYLLIDFVKQNCLYNITFFLFLINIFCFQKKKKRNLIFFFSKNNFQNMF